MRDDLTLTITEYAALCGVCVKTIYKRCGPGHAKKRRFELTVRRAIAALEVSEPMTLWQLAQLIHTKKDRKWLESIIREVLARRPSLADKITYSKSSNRAC